MKKLFIVLMFVLAFSVSTVFAASDITFEWDANSEADLAGYKLYQSSVSVSTLDADNDGIITLQEFLAGSENIISDTLILAGTETVTIQVEDGTWYWVLTAYDTGDNESNPSNEVTAILDTEAPSSPQNFFIKLIMKIVMWLKEIFGGFRALV